MDDAHTAAFLNVEDSINSTINSLHDFKDYISSMKDVGSVSKVRGNSRCFGEFLESGLFGDWTLVVGSREYKVHRMMLCVYSQFFRAHFTSYHFQGGDWRLQRTKLTCPLDTEKYIPDILKYIYHQYIDLNLSNAIGMMCLADMLLISDLINDITEFLGQALKITSNIVPLLLHCLYYKSSFIEKAIEALGENWRDCTARMEFNMIPLDIILTTFNEYDLCAKDLINIDIDIIHELLASDELGVVDEDSLYDLVNDIINDVSTKLKNSELTQEDTVILEAKYEKAISLWDNIRFGFLTAKKMLYADRNKSIPDHILRTAHQHRKLQFYLYSTGGDNNDINTPKNLRARDKYKNNVADTPLMIEYNKSRIPENDPVVTPVRREPIENRVSPVIRSVLAIISSYGDYFSHIAFKRGWSSPAFTISDVYPMFVRAACIVSKIRRDLDISSPGIKVRQLDGCARDWMWTVTHNPSESEEKKREFIRNLVHKTMSDANGYVEGLTEQVIDNAIIEEFKNPSLLYFSLLQ